MKKSPYKFLRSMKRFGFIALLILVGATFYVSDAFAQVDCNGGDPTGVPCAFGDIDCSNDGCSACVVCDNDLLDPRCMADDTICQGRTGGLVENQCRTGECLFVIDSLANPSGCDYTAPGLTGDTSLDEICYYCDPPVLAVDTCGNGVCDSPGEDCNNCSIDCLVPGFDDTCPPAPGVLVNACTPIGITFVTFNGPPFNRGGLGECEDGEICTDNECALQPDQSWDCDITDKVCNNIAQDLCCPAGCMGIPPGFANCRLAAAAGAIDINICDPDCWPAQVCGDIYVQSNNGNPPETCDDGIPGPTAGLMPDGSTISEADCRDPGAVDECTFCGDGIIQTASGEQCDGASLGVCDQLGCDTTTCLCLVPIIDLQVQGSGPPWGPCSLNRQAPADPVQGVLAWASLGLAILALFGLRRRLS